MSSDFKALLVAAGGRIAIGSVNSYIAKNV